MRTIAAMLCLCLCLGALCACGQQEQIPQEYLDALTAEPKEPVAWNVTLTAQTVSASGGTFLFAQSETVPDGQFLTGRSFAIEQKNGEKWDIYSFVEGAELEYNANAVSIPIGGTVSWTVDWTNLYGTLPAGEYRLVKPVMLIGGDGEDTRLVYAEFTLNS